MDLNIMIQLLTKKKLLTFTTITITLKILVVRVNTRPYNLSMKIHCLLTKKTLTKKITMGKTRRQKLLVNESRILLATQNNRELIFLIRQ